MSHRPLSLIIAPHHLRPARQPTHDAAPQKKTARSKNMSDIVHLTPLLFAKNTHLPGLHRSIPFHTRRSLPTKPCWPLQNRPTAGRPPSRTATFQMAAHPMLRISRADTGSFASRLLSVSPDRSTPLPNDLPLASSDQCIYKPEPCPRRAHPFATCLQPSL